MSPREPAPGTTGGSPVRAALLVLAPALLGLVVSLAWSRLTDPVGYVVSGDLAWVPALVGVAAAVAVGIWVVAARRTRHHEWQRTEQALADQGARQRRLLFRLDHELKNPIQGIRTALADEPSDRQRQSIEAQSRRLTRLMSDLRKVGEVEHTPLELGPVDPSELVAEAVDALRELPGADERVVSVSLPQAPRPLPSVTGDGDLLFLALSNVLANALKYSDPGDRIEVRGREAADHLLVEVADTGMGIPAEELETVWEELGRGREARGIEGSGLGLPLVRAIARRHGGDCTLESWHGEGSTLTLRLPLQAPAAVRTS